MEIKKVLLAILFTSCYSFTYQEKAKQLEDCKTLPSVYFEHNSIVFLADSTLKIVNYQTFLNEDSVFNYIKNVLIDNPEISLNVIGKVDFSENLKYGKLRAKKVFEILIDQGVEESRLYVVNQDTLKPIIRRNDFEYMSSEEEKKYARTLNQTVIFTVR